MGHPRPRLRALIPLLLGGPPPPPRFYQKDTNMALSDRTVEWLEGFFTDYQSNRNRVSDWERGFMDDQVKRFEQYEAETRFSPKQWQVINRVAEKLDIPTLEGSDD